VALCAQVKGEVSHCFPLTLNQDQIEVQGVGGILQTCTLQTAVAVALAHFPIVACIADDAAFKHVLLSGPTLFSEVGPVDE
jgi:hypothetical protein